MKHYIQPFERKLALLELSRVAGSRPRPVRNSGKDACFFKVETDKSPEEIARAVSYWERIIEPSPRLTLQVLREATAEVVRNGMSLEKVRDALPFPADGDVPIPGRRSLRYGTHGIHEYRGKFFPQLVRSLINTSGTSRGGVVVDPMCGSGTTPVEAALAGCHALALDLNPLSVLMTRVKCSLLAADPDELIFWYERVRSRLLTAAKEAATSDLAYFTRLPKADQNYLRRWFAPDVLTDLDVISLEIAQVRPVVVRELMLVALSNILRSVSWQKDADLRVRKEIRREAEIDALPQFLEELRRSVYAVLAFRCQIDGSVIGTFDVRQGSARELSQMWPEHVGSADVVITSPPYATALPYLDTDRLSLSYLGLLARPQQRKLDAQMIGNREVNQNQRRAYWRRFQEQNAALPPSVVAVIERIHNLNSGAEVGFRRQNLPALLAKYFFDIRDVLAQVRALLKPSAPAYVVVGNNHTVAGGVRVDIETPALLAEIADSVGLTPSEHIPMEMLTSRDIFKKNAITSEKILVFSKPS